MAKPLLFVPAIAVAGFVALAFFGMNREDPDALPSTLEGREVPAVKVEPLGDAPVPTDAMLRAPGVKLVNFWASWCAPCRAEHPMLEKLAAEGVQINGINYKDKPDAALAFLAELGSPYATIGADSSGRMGIDWGIYGVPETFVINGEGKVILRLPGPITAENLESTIRPALAKAATP